VQFRNSSAKVKISIVLIRPLLIAVLDDEPQMRRALRRLLCSFGHEVREFADGQSFLQSCNTIQFDCLLLDLHMPGMNGLDVLKSLQLTHNPPAAIVITAHDVPGCEQHVRDLGANACFLKPVDHQILLTAIEHSTGGSARNEYHAEN